MNALKFLRKPSYTLILTAFSHCPDFHGTKVELRFMVGNPTLWGFLKNTHCSKAAPKQTSIYQNNDSAYPEPDAKITVISMQNW